MKKALLTYGYGLKNAGDMAITLGAIELLNKKYEVTILSRFDASHPEYEKSRKFIHSKFPEVTIVSSPFKLNRNAGITTRVKDHITGGLQVAGLVKNRKLDELIEESDLVVFNGGNLFRCESFSDFARLIALMAPLRKARESDIPYFVFPQSASTINWFGKGFMEGILAKADKIWTREDHSYNYLSQNIGIDNIEKSIDLAFFLQHRTDGSEKINRKKKEISITARAHTVGDLTEFDDIKRKAIKESLKQAIFRINRDNEEAHFQLVIQTEKDAKITNELYRELRDKVNIDLVEIYDPLRLIDLYSNSNLLLGMRLHSIIMALSSGTPAVGLFDEKWGLKNPGMMSKFSLPYKFIEQNGSLEEMAVEILGNESKMRKQILELIETEEEKFKDVFL